MDYYDESSPSAKDPAGHPLLQGNTLFAITAILLITLPVIAAVAYLRLRPSANSVNNAVNITTAVQAKPTPLPTAITAQIRIATGNTNRFFLTDRQGRISGHNPETGKVTKAIPNTSFYEVDNENGYSGDLVSMLKLTDGRIAYFLKVDKPEFPLTLHVQPSRNFPPDCILYYQDSSGTTTPHPLVTDPGRTAPLDYTIDMNNGQLVIKPK